MLNHTAFEGTLSLESESHIHFVQLLTEDHGVDVSTAVHHSALDPELKDS